MKTLYITDLDGTLLDPDEKTSEYTNKTVNDLLSKGMIISYATARSYTTAKKVTTGLTMKYPAVVHNGTFIVDRDGSIVYKNTFCHTDSALILDMIIQSDLSPVVYSLIDGREQFSYIRKTLNRETLTFLSSRENDKRNREVLSTDSLYDGEIYYFTLIGDEKKTKPLYDHLKDTFRCYFQRDIYSGDYWLEILPKSATKANAVKKLAEILKCERIVAFGDGINDVPMFIQSDECYAVENAVDSLKEISTQIIDSNAHDGVAKWLLMRYNSDIQKDL